VIKQDKAKLPWGMICFSLFLVWLFWPFGKQSQQSTSQPSQQAEQKTSMSENGSTTQTDSVKYTWIYDQTTDSMTGKISSFAAIDSTNTLNFDFPYSGPQHATLMLRKHPQHGKDIILNIERGQFLCNGYSGCSVLVRFDENKPVRYSASEPSDNSTTTIFLSNYAGFIKSMMKAKHLRIQAEFYQQGNQVLEFDVSSFDEKKYLGKY
jgi:hypothetical protein